MWSSGRARSARTAGSPMSFSPQTGLVYVPYMQLGVHFKRGDEPGVLGFSGMSIRAVRRRMPLDGKGALIAWDPVRQKAAGRSRSTPCGTGGPWPQPATSSSKAPATAISRPMTPGRARALWRFYAGMGIIAAPMTYSIGGRQYVAVLAGYGGGTAAWGKALDAGWSYKGQRRLLTFALDGKAVLPLSRPRFTPVKPLDNPSLKFDPADVVAGEKLFLRCAFCHGLGLHGTGGPAPDLRESPIAFHPDSLWSVVHDGALLQNGMPQFAESPATK